MPRWTVGRGDSQLILDVTGDQISLDVPSGLPFVADVETAQDLRMKLGAAIGAALGPDQS